MISFHQPIYVTETLPRTASLKVKQTKTCDASFRYRSGMTVRTNRTVCRLLACVETDSSLRNRTSAANRIAMSAAPAILAVRYNWGGGHMLHTFTLHEDAWFRDEDVFANGQVTVYRVGGMPDGKTARIANFGAPNRNDWRIMRINGDNTQTGWSGHYESVDEALAALQQVPQ
jgi:hypothetical protein